MNRVKDSRVVPSTQSDLMRWAAMAGIAGPVVFTLGFVAQEQLRRGEYDPVSVVAAPWRRATTAGFSRSTSSSSGVLTMIFAVGLHRGLAPSRARNCRPVALFVSGAANVLAAIFPLREDAVGATYDPGGHQSRRHALLCVKLHRSDCAVASMRCRPALAQHLPAGRWPLECWLRLSFPLMGALVIPDDAPLHDWAGLAQRFILLVLLFPARIALAIRLLRVSHQRVLADQVPHVPVDILARTTGRGSAYGTRSRTLRRTR